jgi:hypothetical protein
MHPMGSGSRTLRELAVTAVALLALAGCGGAGYVITTGGQGVTEPSTTAPATVLTIVVDDGSGGQRTVHLTCEPAGGDHPDPAAACAVLERAGAEQLPPVPKDRMCTQIYGGAQTARITGTWRGKAVDARLSRKDGCEMARWDALQGLLPET